MTQIRWREVDTASASDLDKLVTVGGKVCILQCKVQVQRKQWNEASASEKTVTDEVWTDVEIVKNTTSSQHI